MLQIPHFHKYLEMNSTYIQDASKESSPPQLEDILVVVFLFIIFLLAESGNVSILITLLKQKIRSPTVLLLKALIVSSSLTGILYVFPPCLTILFSDWLLNKTLCTIQAFLKNVFVSWTSLLLAVLSIERWLTKPVANRSRSKNFYGKILLETLLLSGLLQCVSFFGGHHYLYIPEMMSCDYQTGIDSVNYILITSIIPCCVSLLLTSKELWSTIMESNRVSPQRFSIAVNRTIYRPSVVQLRDLNKQVKRNLTLLQLLVAIVITISSCLRLVSPRSSGYNVYMKTILWLINISCLLLPVFCIAMRKSLKRSLFMTDRQSVSPMISSSHYPHINNQPPKPRQDCKNSKEVPCFLAKKHSDLGISLKYALNQDLDSDDSGKIDHCSQADKKTSVFSIISCDIQIDKVNDNHNNNRLSVNSFSDSLDSVFVSVNTPRDERSISITSRRESIGDISSRSRNRMSPSDHTHSRHMSSGSEVSCNRRQNLPPLNVTITANVPMKGWEGEQRRVSTTNKHSFSRRVSEFPLLTPVEDAGSLECSPRVSVESKQSTSTSSYRQTRLSRLNSCLQKLHE